MRDILLVEDNAAQELLMLHALQKIETVRVTVKRDGEEALKAILEQESPYAVVLLDLKLPKLTGLEVLEGVRKSVNAAFTPVVVFTTSSQQSDVVASYSMGANAYVQKPENFADIRRVLNGICDFWLRINVSPNPLVDPRSR